MVEVNKRNDRAGGGQIINEGRRAERIGGVHEGGGVESNLVRRRRWGQRLLLCVCV